MVGEFSTEELQVAGKFEGLALCGHFKRDEEYQALCAFGGEGEDLGNAGESEY